MTNFDWSKAAARELWTSHLANATKVGGVDGVFADFPGHAGSKTLFLTLFLTLVRLDPPWAIARAMIGIIITVSVCVSTWAQPVSITKFTPDAHPIVHTLTFTLTLAPPFRVRIRLILIYEYSRLRAPALIRLVTDHTKLIITLLAMKARVKLTLTLLP